MESTIQEINDVIPTLLKIPNNYKAFTDNILIVITLIIAIIIYDSKAHNKIYKNEGKLRNDTSAESFTFGMLITFIVLFSLPVITNFLLLDMNKNNPWYSTIIEKLVQYNQLLTNGFSLLALFIVLWYIVGINKDTLFPNKRTNILYPNTPEAAIFITIIILFALNIIHGILTLLGYNLLSFIPYLTNIGFLYSFITWSIKKTVETLETAKTTTSDSKIPAFDMEKIINDGDFIKYGVLFIFIIMAFIIMSIASFDPKAFTSKQYVYAVSMIAFLIMGVSYITMFKNQSILLPGIAMLLIFVSVMLYYYSTLSISSFASASYIINFTLGSGILVGLSLFFFLFSNYLKSLGGWLGVLVYFIFYIPCLLLDFIRYIMNEMNMTTNIVFVLLGIEVCLLLLYVYYPKISGLALTNSLGLLNDSLFLDNEHTIGNSEQFKLPTSNVLDSVVAMNNKIIYNQNYSLSMWIYLNTESHSYASYAKETDIFYYGDGAYGKPRIAYFNNTDTSVTIPGKDKYKVYFTNIPGNNYYEISLPSQKWNHFVFNYSSQKVDLYLNGNLEYTFAFDKNSPTYSVSDVVKVGAKNGLNGAICNIQYFHTPLSSQKITTMYNLLMYKNPPINSNIKVTDNKYV